MVTEIRKPPELLSPAHNVNNVHPEWYIKICGTFCSQCRRAYNFEDSYILLKLCRSKGQMRGPRCINCGKILRTRSKPNPKSGFWEKVETIEGIKQIQHEE